MEIAYSITLAAFRSSGTMMFAMLRWTKRSPGFRSQIVVSGILESAQPSQRVSGVWPRACFWRRVGLVWAVRFA